MSSYLFILILCDVGLMWWTLYVSTLLWPDILLIYRVNSSLGVATPRRCQETQEEELHHTQEAKAQAQEGQVGRAQVLPRRRQRQDQPPSSWMPQWGVWCRHLHGCPFRQAVLRQVRAHLRLQPRRGEVMQVWTERAAAIIPTLQNLLCTFIRFNDENIEPFKKYSFCFPVISQYDAWL